MSQAHDDGDGLSQELRFFWLYARQVDRLRFADGASLGNGEVYAKFVRSELLRGQRVSQDAQLTAESPPKDFASGFAHLGGKVIGAILCRPASLSSLLLVLEGDSGKSKTSHFA